MEIYTCIGYKTLGLNSRPLAQKKPVKLHQKAELLKARLVEAFRTFNCNHKLLY